MNLEIKKELENSILESLDRAEKLQGEERATELKNVAILVDKLRDDYETEENFLDKRHKMEFDEEIERMKIEIEREKVKIEKDRSEMDYKAKGKINMNSLIGNGILAMTTISCMAFEARGFIVPKIGSNLLARVGRD